jgi:hypothetical protein
MKQVKSYQKKQAAQEATIRKLRAQACNNILCCAQACYMPVPLVFVYEIKCLSQFDQVCDFLFYLLLKPDS